MGYSLDKPVFRCHFRVVISAADTWLPLGADGNAQDGIICYLTEQRNCKGQGQSPRAVIKMGRLSLVTSALLLVTFVAELTSGQGKVDDDENEGGIEARR